MWPAPLVAFIRLFNGGLYWHAHEALEAAWQRNRSPFYRGLIIYASAFVHACRGNPQGVLIQLGKLPRYLGGLPDAYLGLDVAALLAHGRAVARAVRQAGMPRGPELARVIPWPTLRLDPARLRGDEPELRSPQPPGS